MTGKLIRCFLMLSAAACLFSLPVCRTAVYADSHREFEYDVGTQWTNDDVDEMLDYATYWVGKISYASSQNNTDPNNTRWEELHDGGSTDCSWFVYHVLFRYGLLEDDFVHSYEWGNNPSCYPGAVNIGTDISDASPGDIICTGKGTKSQNSHVAIYIGDGQVVECCAGRGVIISDAPGSPRQIVHFNCIPTERLNKTVNTE